MNDDDIIRQRIAGRSVRAIAKAQGCSAAQVNEAIDRWSACAINAETRRVLGYLGPNVGDVYNIRISRLNPAVAKIVYG
jgi:hypothetical protein